jgi:hypothetical protein
MNTILNPRTRMKRTVLFVLISLLALHVSSQSGDVEILSLGRNGLLSWTNSSLNVTCRVEWAATVDGPWHGSWESLANIVVTNSVTSCEVPMFYRVVAMVPLPPPADQYHRRGFARVAGGTHRRSNFCGY